MLGDLRKELGSIGVPLLQEHEFDHLKDSLTSTKPGEGLGCYNNKIWTAGQHDAAHPMPAPAEVSKTTAPGQQAPWVRAAPADVGGLHNTKH